MNVAIAHANLPTTGGGITRWRPYVDALKLARIGIGIGALTSLLLNVDQSLECLVVLAQDFRTSDRVLKLVLCFTALVGLALTIWYWTRTLEYRFLRGANGSVGVRRFLRELPRAVGLIPFAGMLTAILRARPEAMIELSVATVALAVAFYTFCMLRRRYIGVTAGQTGLPRTSWWVLVGTAAFMILAALTFTADAQLAQWIGPLTVILSAAAAWMVLCGALAFLGGRFSIPVFWLVLVWLVAWSGLNCNDDHEIRHVASSAGVSGPRRALAKMEATFNDWLRNRADRGDFAGQPYPVVVVAAEGGGIYAAYHTSLALAELQDAQPAFAQHVFAISGVSGGSVGASVFAALMAGRPQTSGISPTNALSPTGASTSATKAFFYRDFLAPVIAKGVYPDLLERFNVFPIAAADRGRALEQSLEAAWSSTNRSPMPTAANPFASDFDALWPNFTRGATPALLLNTTEVETGRDQVLSPLGPATFGRPNMFFGDHPSCHMRLSTAAVLSARFPIVTPAGGEPTVLSPSGAIGYRRYVDGGYFENSGMGTLADVVAALLIYRETPKALPFRLVVVRIAMDDAAAAEDDGDTPATAIANGKDSREKFTTSAFEELGSPVRTLLNTRSARQEAALARMHDLVDPPKNECAYKQLLLSNHPLPLPLGWLLSERAKLEIQKQVELRSRHLLDVLKLIEPEKRCQGGNAPTAIQAEAHRNVHDSEHGAR